jgi:hypothetical protein
MAEDLERRLARKGQSGFRGKYLYLAREVKTDVFTGAPRARVQRVLLRSLQLQPGRVPTSRFLAACYAHLGRLDEAREIIEQLRALTSVVVPNADHWRNPGQREFYLSGLRLAAGEET